MNIALPFVGRAKEIALLQRLHAQRKHVLILGAKGVGKSALVAHLRQSLRLHVCPASERLSEICEALEREFRLDAGDFHLIQRKNRLLRLLKESQRAVVFDGASWTTPKLASFIESVSERAAVWLCVRSEHPWDIGRVWPLLVRFEKVEIKPFHPAETRGLVEAAIRLGIAPPSAADAIERLHHLCAGNPKILCELIEGLATGQYDPHKKFDLRLLDLDRRIQHMPEAGGLHRLRTPGNELPLNKAKPKHEQDRQARRIIPPAKAVEPAHRRGHRPDDGSRAAAMAAELLPRNEPGGRRVDRLRSVEVVGKVSDIRPAECAG